LLHSRFIVLLYLGWLDLHKPLFVILHLVAFRLQLLVILRLDL